VYEWAIEQQMEYKYRQRKTMFMEKNNSKFTYKTMNCEPLWSKTVIICKSVQLLP